jgi:hypothetical protein
MIGRAKEEHPGLSERELCRLFEVSRSWYYGRPSSKEKAAEYVELRDAIERIVLEFPFSTVIAESPRSSTGEDGR